jgi:isopenicillin-N epimerase
MPEFGLACRAEFQLDHSTAQLNHGSFGATPVSVRDAAEAWRRRMEADPTHFVRRVWPEAVAAARTALAAFLHADPDGLVLVENATQGANAVLRSLELQPGDFIVTTNHGYRAVAKTVEYVCRRAGATHLRLDFGRAVPTASDIAAQLPPRTRLLIVDHITSPSALVLPVAEILAAARKSGVPVLVDGAHAPGQLPLDLAALDADFYVGNCHKWLFAAKGAAFLSVAPAHRAGIHPPTISHGLDQGLAAEFDWTGTRDVGAWLSIPDGLAFGARYGWPQIRAYNNALCAAMAARLAAAFGTEILGPPEARAHLAAIRLPLGGACDEKRALALLTKLYDVVRVQAPIMAFENALWVRVSAQIYNVAADADRLACVDWAALEQ